MLRYRLNDPEVGLEPDEEGYVRVDKLLTFPELEGGTAEDIERVGRESLGARGRRFDVSEVPGTDGGLRIRALYRHPEESRPSRSFRGRYDITPYVRDEGRYGCGWLRHAPQPRNANGWHRPGFSPSPSGEAPKEARSAGAEQASSLAPPSGPATFALSPASSSIGEGKYDIEEQFNALRPAALQIGGGKTHANGKDGADSLAAGLEGLSSASASTEASSSAQKAEVWERFIEPETNRVWFWNEECNEAFFEDDPIAGWQCFQDAEGRPWWWHGSTGRFFFEKEPLQEEEEDDDDDHEAMEV